MLDVDAQVVGTLDGSMTFFAWSSAHSFGQIPKQRQAIVRPEIRNDGFPAYAEGPGVANEWTEACHRAPRYAVDQDALLVALGEVFSLSLTMLPIEAGVAQADNCKFPVVLHDRQTARPERLERSAKASMRLLALPRGMEQMLSPLRGPNSLARSAFAP